MGNFVLFYWRDNCQAICGSIWVEEILPDRFYSFKYFFLFFRNQDCFILTLEMTTHRPKVSIAHSQKCAANHFDIWRKILSFGENLDFWPKIWILTKISSFGQSLDFLTKISMSNISSFGQHLYFWPKLSARKVDYWPKFIFLLKTPNGLINIKFHTN